MKSLLAAALAGASTLALAASAFAADLTLSAKIDAVTVFPDGALVTRLGDIAIPAGSHQVILQGLPAGVDPASIRVEGVADQALTIGSAEMKSVAADVKPDTEVLKKVRDLRAELATVNGKIDAAEMQKRTIERFSIATPEASAKEGKPIDIAQWRAAWTAVGEGAAEINAQLTALRARAAEIDTEIRSIEATLGRTRPNLAPRLDVAVAIEAEADAKAKLKIIYRVRGARWAPVYDARLSTGATGVKPSIAFVRRASVTQNTGEDWTDASLTLSTTRVAGGVAAPDMGSLVANIFEPTFYGRAVSSGVAAPPAPPQPAARAQPMDEALAKPAEPRQRTAEEQEAAADSSTFSAEYRLPGKVTVAKDGSPKTVRLSSRDIEPELQVKAAPSLDTTAYLTARFANADDAALLPGEVLLFRDGVFVGKTRIGLTASGDQLDLGFGADDRVKIERAPVKKRENDPGWFTASKYQISDFRTVVTNLHARPMRVTIVDRVPVSENTAIVVEQLRETTAPTEKQVGDKRGVMAWSWEMQPNEKKEVRVAYRMKWPADRDIRLTAQGGR
ncbi:mucoidy inhibitor MuiA family protein [Terrarubrum flagellatum]|uniref:mucoidy inhibitor MuiA family protein n=1 Tax=Terrirubrum flagellatum TaxID=2895980 RepID=UPI003144EF34